MLREIQEINHHLSTISSVDFNLHPGVEEVIMGMRLAVLAHHTLAFLRALHSRPIAITVVFATLRFFARAPSLRHEGGNPLESPRVSEVCQLLGFVDL